MAVNGPDKDNIIDLAKERKKQRTLNKQKQSADKKKKAGASKFGGSNQQIGWMSYLQFAAFIALFAYFLQQCGR